MKKYIVFCVTVLLLISLLPTSVFAAGPVEYTIDVRNRTGEAVELSYTGSDNITHFVKIGAGVTSLTINEGVYSYFASPKCGNIAGQMNISQQRQTLWISCDDANPSLSVTKTNKKSASCDPTSLTIYDDQTSGDIWVLLSCSWSLAEWESIFNSFILDDHVWVYKGTSMSVESFESMCGLFGLYNPDWIQNALNYTHPNGAVPYCIY